MHLDNIHASTIRTPPEDGIHLTNAHEYFTCGRCWELAEALGELHPDGRIIEIRVSNGSWNMLIHAGLETGPDVIDIEGRHDKESWISRWTAPWSDAELVFRGRRGDFLGYDNNQTRLIARHFARLVARAVNLRVPIRNPDMKKAA